MEANSNFITQQDPNDIDAVDKDVEALVQAQKVHVPIDDEDTRRRKGAKFEEYLEESGLPICFQIIFTEIIKKEIPEDQVFQYTATRLK